MEFCHLLLAFLPCISTSHPLVSLTCLALWYHRYSSDLLIAESATAEDRFSWLLVLCKAWTEVIWVNTSYLLLSFCFLMLAMLKTSFERIKKKPQLWDVLHINLGSLFIQLTHEHTHFPIQNNRDFWALRLCISNMCQAVAFLRHQSQSIPSLWCGNGQFHWLSCWSSQEVRSKIKGTWVIFLLNTFSLNT